MLHKSSAQTAPAWAAKHAYLKYREGRGWYYIRAVPRKLWVPGRSSPIQKALGVERREVEKNYAREHAEVENEFERWATEEPKRNTTTLNSGAVQVTKLTPTSLRRIIAEYRETVLQADLNWRGTELAKARSDPDNFYAEAGKVHHADDYYLMLAGDETITLDDVVGYVVHVARKKKLDTLKRQQQCGDYARGISVDDKIYDEEDRRRLMQSRLAAEIDVLAKISAGDAALFTAIKAEVEAVRVVAKATTATWGDTIGAWEKFHEQSGKPLDQRRQIVAYLWRFARWVNKQPGEVDRTDFIQWRDERLAAGVSLKTIESRDRLLLGTMYRRAINADVLPRGFDIPTTGIDTPKLSGTAPQTVQPRGYNDTEAAAILAAAVKETDPLYRWVPLLMYYSGARVGEPVHLRPEDVRLIEGVWCWCPKQHDGERTQKSGFSNRPVPLHPAISDDFRAFVAKKKKEKAKYLFFSDWNPRGQTVERVGIGKEKPGKKAIERLREWAHKVAKKNGIKLGEAHGLEPNHGWRYMFETMCERAGISDDVQRWFTGHEAKDAHGGYKKADVIAMFGALNKFPEPIDFLTISR